MTEAPQSGSVDEAVEAADPVPDGAEDDLVVVQAHSAPTDGIPGQGLPPVCPHLLVPGASWRSTRPLREHRCTAVAPEISPSFDTQRSLCLVVEHETCPRFRAAAARRRTRWAGTPESLAAFDARVARRVPRVAPIALDRPNAMTGPLAWLGSGRRLARLGLAAVMIGAAALLLAARFAGTPAAPATSSPTVASPSAEVASPSP